MTIPSLGVFAAFGVIGVLWDKIKLFFSFIQNIIFVNITSDYMASIALIGYLKSIGYTQIQTSDHYYRTFNVFSKLKMKRYVVFFSGLCVEKSRMFLRKKCKFVYISTEDRYNYKVSFIRGTINCKELIKNSEIYLNQCRSNFSTNTRYRVETITKEEDKKNNSSDALIMNTSIDTVDEESIQCRFLSSETHLPEDMINNSNQYDSLFYPKYILEIYNQCEIWKNHQQWFLERQIPWKRGYLLHGEPGTGKTSFVRYVAQKLDLPIFCFDLASLNNVHFIKEWTKVKSHAPCIALFEDFDRVFEGRKNVSHLMNTDNLTFECFLNCIDGVDSNNGILSFITVNSLSKISDAIASEEAFISRPGRIDQVISFGCIASAERQAMVEYMLPDDSKMWDDLVEQGENKTSAQFQQICSDIALNRFWNKENV